MALKANLKKITHDPSFTQESGTTHIATFLARRIHKMGQAHHQTRLQAGRNFASKPLFLLHVSLDQSHLDTNGPVTILNHVHVMLCHHI